MSRSRTQRNLLLTEIHAAMEIDWGGSWGWGLLLITVTTAVHAMGVVMMFHGLRWIGKSLGGHQGHIRHPLVFAVATVAIVGLLLAVLHGIEAGMWAAAYRLLGAIGSQRDAMLYSLDSFTTRGASGLLLGAEWQLMGALESADGMLLFGISTAFVFMVLQRVVGIIDRLDGSLR
jgi:hypothetical protein